MCNRVLEIVNACHKICCVLLLTTIVGCVQNTGPTETPGTDTTGIIISNPVVANIEGYQATIASQTRSTYSWTATNAVITDGQGTPSITFTAGTENMMELWCIVTNSANVSRRHSIQIPVAPDNGRRALRIAQQPRSVTVQLGHTATFTVEASGGTPPYTYQWQKNNQNIPGATQNQYTTPAIVTGDNNSNFRAIVSDGATHSLNSRQAKLVTVVGILPTLDVSPSSLFFAYTLNSTLPPPQAITVTISGDTMSWTATAQTTNGGNWLSLSQSGRALTVLVNPWSVQAGTYNGFVTIAAPGAQGSPKTVNVTLTVSRPSTSTFTVYDALLFSGKPDLSSYGIKKDWIVYSSSLWPPGTNFDTWPNPLPNEEYARAQARMSVGQSDNNFVQLDIEHWETDERRIGGTNVNQSVTYLRQELAWFKNERPQLTVGYYSQVPITDYWSPVTGDQARIATWKAANDRLQPLANDVDVLFPSTYVYYPDQQAWVTFANANIAEAKRLARGKPVYAYVSMEPHPSGTLSGDLSYDYFRLVLQTAKNSGANGVIIWGGWQRTWNENAAWWRATRDFMATL